MAKEKATEKLVVKMVEYFDDHWYKITFPPDYDGYLPQGYKIPIGRIDWVKSVTSIQGIVAESWLANWRGEVGNEEADTVLIEKRDKGLYVHAGTEILDQKGVVIFNNPKNPAYILEEINEMKVKLKEKERPHIVIYDQQAALELYRYRQLFEIIKPRVVATEMTVYSLDHRFGGTLDKLWDITGGTFKGIHGSPLSLDTGYYMADIKSGAPKPQKHLEQIAAYTRAWEEGREDDKRIVGGLIIYTNATQNKSGIEGIKIVVHTRDEMKEAFNVFKAEIVVDKAHASQKPKILELPSLMSLD